MARYYRHFKGGFYKLIGTARDCDAPPESTSEVYEVEVYMAMQDNGRFKKGQWWYREKEKFHGLRGGIKRMRKLSLFESALLVAGFADKIGN